jgi:hypothetical protein
MSYRVVILDIERRISVLKETKNKLDIHRHDLKRHGIHEAFIDFLTIQLTAPSQKILRLSTLFDQWQNNPSQQTALQLHNVIHRIKNHIVILSKVDIIVRELINAYARPGQLNDRELAKFRIMIAQLNEKFTKYYKAIESTELKQSILIATALELTEMLNQIEEDPNNKRNKYDMYQLIQYQLKEIKVRIKHNTILTNRYKSELFTKLEQHLLKEFKIIYKLANNAVRSEAALEQTIIGYSDIKRLQLDRQRVNYLLQELFKTKCEIEQSRLNNTNFSKENYTNVLQQIKKLNSYLDTNEKFINALMKERIHSR